MTRTVLMAFIAMLSLGRHPEAIGVAGILLSPAFRDMIPKTGTFATISLSNGPGCNQAFVGLRYDACCRMMRFAQEYCFIVCFG
jgi:hypothetical protein